MKINVKVRLKNPTFWLTFIASAVPCVYFVLGVFDVIPLITEEKTINALGIIISFLTMIGVLNDPTTDGLSDSEQAMTYTKPKK